jgi:hypothetical protein
MISTYNIDILSPFGELLINKDLDDDDNENVDEEVESVAAELGSKSFATDLEDAAIDEDILAPDIPDAPSFTKFINVRNSTQPLRKTRALPQMQKYGYKAGSTDRVKRVADGERYSSKSIDHAGIIVDDAPYNLSEPIATLIRCDDTLFVGIGEVTDIRLDSKSVTVEQLSIDALRERKVTKRFQILSLIPATKEDDPDCKHDWRSARILRDVLSAPGRLVLPVDPALSTRVQGKPYYLFESSVLQLLDDVTLQLNKQIPKFTPTSNFPYHEAAGKWSV